MKTFVLKSENIAPKWYVVDAEGVVLGRLATDVARILQGKHLPTYTPFISNRDHVIVLNADKVKVTGNKMENKLYFRHSGYTGNLKITPLKDMMANKPTDVIYEAVRGMIPKNKLGSHSMTRLLIYTGTEHPHEAQKPEVYKIVSKYAKESK
jgi:large subunit ribosomal protein L13